MAARMCNSGGNRRLVGLLIVELPGTASLFPLRLHGSEPAGS